MKATARQVLQSVPVQEMARLKPSTLVRAHSELLTDDRRRQRYYDILDRMRKDPSSVDPEFVRMRDRAREIVSGAQFLYRGMAIRYDKAPPRVGGRAQFGAPSRGFTRYQSWSLDRYQAEFYAWVASGDDVDPWIGPEWLVVIQCPSRLVLPYVMAVNEPDEEGPLETNEVVVASVSVSGRFVKSWDSRLIPTTRLAVVRVDRVGS